VSDFALRRPRPLWHWLAAVAVVAAVVVGVIIAVSSGGEPAPPEQPAASTFERDAAAPLAKLAAANRTLSDQASSLALTAPPEQVSAMLDATLDATRTARAAITALGPHPAEPLSVPLAGVFEAQQRYLHEAADAVNTPSAAAADHLQQTHDTLVNAYAALSGRVRGLAAPQGADQLAAWVEQR
jgi:energy-converting hydrogenase Eha subunit A